MLGIWFEFESWTRRVLNADNDEDNDDDDDNDDLLEQLVYCESDKMSPTSSSHWTTSFEFLSLRLINCGRETRLTVEFYL